MGKLSGAIGFSFSKLERSLKIACEWLYISIPNSIIIVGSGVKNLLKSKLSFIIGKIGFETLH